MKRHGFTAPWIPSRFKRISLFLGHSPPALAGSANNFVPIYFLIPLPFLFLPLLHLPFPLLPSLDLAKASFAPPILAGRSGSRTFKIAFHIHLLWGLVLAA